MCSCVSPCLQPAFTIAKSWRRNTQRASPACHRASVMSHNPSQKIFRVEVQMERQYAQSLFIELLAKKINYWLEGSTIGVVQIDQCFVGFKDRLAGAGARIPDAA